MNMNVCNFSWKMFYLIGLGLGDAKDVTLKGYEIIKKCKRIYLEAYTSILSFGTSKENLVNKFLLELLETNNFSFSIGKILRTRRYYFGRSRND